MRKKTLRFALIALVLFIIFVVVARRAGWIGSSAAQRVTTEQAELRNIVETVTASGKIQPVTEVKISPDVSGEIVEILVEEGQFVTRGQLLVRINPELYISALDRVEASLNTSKANLASARARKAQSEAQFINARASFERNQQLFNQDAISKAEFDTARAQFLIQQAEVEAANQSVIAAEFQVKSAEAALREARESLTKTNIFAPMDGTISRLDAKRGERVVGTSQFTGTEILRIANLNAMELQVEVNENDIIRVNQGDTAHIQVDAWGRESFRGIVTSIANSAISLAPGVDQMTNFQVRIRILPESYSHLVREETPNLSPFRPGMSASADIRTRRVENAISVPIQAVTTRQMPVALSDTIDQPTTNPVRDQETRLQEYVFVVEDGKVKLQAVESGVQDSNFIQIVSGLEQGQEVVTGPFRAVSQLLKDGDAIIVVSRSQLFAE
ncbi:MAG: efflux RND transporter periplasmic adaptor subunit [Bacteroidales bacterium]